MAVGSLVNLDGSEGMVILRQGYWALVWIESTQEERWVSIR